jgi:hypothetical protein
MMADSTGIRWATKIRSVFKSFSNNTVSNAEIKGEVEIDESLSVV